MYQLRIPCVVTLLSACLLTGCSSLSNNQQANYPQQSYLMNYDIVQMTQGGVSDEVIIGSIRSRGGNFDLSPEGIIALKQQRVSDKVVQFMQQHVNQPKEETANVSHSTTVITPVIQPGIIFGPRFGHPYHHHHHRKRNHAHISWNW